MSRPETQDYDYPPGLGGHRTRTHERDQGVHYSTSFQQQDRRLSNAGQAYPGIPGGMARSYGMQDGYGLALAESQGPNRHNSTQSLAHLSPAPSFSSYNHHNHHPSPPPSLPAGAVYTSSSPSDRDIFYQRHPQTSNPQQSTSNSLAARATLWWGELEPWMDEEYAKQVCGLMGWDPVNLKVPHPPPDSATGQQPNNPGYCFLTFPTPAHAASVLAQINNGGPGGKGTPTPMPNSTKPFVMNWASSVSSASPMSASFPAAAAAAQPQVVAQQQFPKEYSIFVGDLAPETSNSDLVAVFRNPVLGLRNDREPKFIRPFLSCKSAKIMLDPLTGVSRGYGFVRFTDEADQQRALIEMHGLYCLSRPMRISPATAKFKPPTSASPFDMPQVSYGPQATGGPDQAVTIALPLPNTTQTKSVSAPIASAGSGMSLNSNTVSNSMSSSSLGGSHSSNSLSSATGSSASIATSAFGSDEMLNNIPHSVLTQIAQQYTNNDLSKLQNLSPYHEEELRRIIAAHVENPSTRYVVSEESWKHHAQARAILGNLIGPNGEQLTSTDPYNTTVFVGGLSPLISEETLRTFFAPFGDIHYVKVPVGKHCGFVQFVRKADAEKAIEKMQGFPIGGSRIRLSWGRSQYKAAQAAAQAAQAAALQTTYVAPAPATATISQDHALAILQKFGMPYPPSSAGYDSSEVENALLNNGYSSIAPRLEQQQKEIQEDPNMFLTRPEIHRTQSNFSPFSPDPNNLYTSSESVRRDINSYSRLDNLPHPSKAYAPGFFPQQPDIKVNTAVNNGSGKVSPISARPSSASRYSFAENSDPPAPLNRASGRSEAPISRPASGQMAAEHHESDPIHDLNGTLASLELDRPWRAADSVNKAHSG